MNISKRTFNPLLSKSFRYSQSENAELKYIGNWGATIHPLTIASSTWVIETGNVTLSSESNTTSTTDVIITGQPGENTIINKVTLSDGQVDERKLLLKIVSNDDPQYRDDYGR